MHGIAPHPSVLGASSSAAGPGAAQPMAGHMGVTGGRVGITIRKLSAEGDRKWRQRRAPWSAAERAALATAGIGAAGAVTAGAVKADAVKAGAVKAGAVADGAVKAGAVKAGAVADGAVADGAVADGAVDEDAVDEDAATGVDDAAAEDDTAMEDVGAPCAESVGDREPEPQGHRPRHRSAKRRAHRAKNHAMKLLGNVPRQGHTFTNRGAYQESGSALACGKTKCEEHTCLPDAIFNALSAMGVSVSKEETLSIMPSDGGDARVIDASNFMEARGLVMKMRSDLMRETGGPELALFNVLTGVFIVCLSIFRQDNLPNDNHTLVFRADTGQLLDNYRWHSIATLEPKDKETKEAARKVFMHGFKGARRILIGRIYEISPQVETNKRPREGA